MLITSTNIIVAMVLVVLSLVTLPFVAGLITKYPFDVVAARSPL